MNSTAGVIAGFLVIGGAVALYRFGRRKAEQLRRTIREFNHGAGDGAVLDFEQDPDTGVFKPKA